MPYINGLNDVGNGDLAAAGGKALGLAGLIHAGPAKRKEQPP
jgi:pyruvate,water dikinase